MRGDVYRKPAPRASRVHEQDGPRYAVVVQSDALVVSTWLVAPTSASARPFSFRPEIELLGKTTRVLVEQTVAVDPQRLGDLVGHLSHSEMRAVNYALRKVLGLDR